MRPEGSGLDPALLAAADALARRDVRLPPFLRKAWVSEAARLRYAQPLQRAVAAWEAASWRSAGRVRPCAQARLAEADYPTWLAAAETAGLCVAPLRVVEGPDGRVTDVVAVGRRDVAAFKTRWIAGDHDAMGALLGYPACCRAFFAAAVVARGFADPVWLAARATPGVEAEGADLTVTGHAQLNPLLRRVGLRATPHLCCNLACEASARLSDKILALAAENGQAAEVASLIEALDWPMRWSALHGVAEIHTPVLKLAAPTDAVAGRLGVNWRGGPMPDEAASGLSFPYRPPGGRKQQILVPPLHRA